MNFTWSAFCRGDDTEFRDATDAGISTIIEYDWEFGDGFLVGNTYPAQLPDDGIPGAQSNGGRTSGTFKDPNHRFDTFGQKNVKLSVLTNDGCLKDTTILVTILNYDAPTAISNYNETFESGQGSWFETKANQFGYPAVTGDTTWLFGAPSGTVINTASSGANAWWTGGNSAAAVVNSTYSNNEKSAVIGPCFDITSIKRPMISLDYWVDTEDRFDGAVLQYSIDGGSSWTAIGDDSGLGINWYNGRALTGNPGSQSLGQFGWSGRQGQWKTARYNLDQIPKANRNEVIFRIAFGSNNDNDLGAAQFNGFAFDNIYIGEKQRNVLVEYFTNAGISSTANDYLNNLLDEQTTVLNKDSSDFYKIQYHIANPSPDPINDENSTDPAARSLLYGVSQPPVGIMDGILGNYYGTTFNGDQTKIDAGEVDRRALESPQFDIQLTAVGAAIDSVNYDIVLTYIDSMQSLSTPVFVHAGLVEDNLSGNRFVLRKLLLGSDGDELRLTWTNGTSQALSLRALINEPIGANNPNMYLVVFVQGSNKRMYQSLMIKLPNKSQSTIVGIEDDPALARVRDIQIFPNPANQHFNLALESNFGETLTLPGFTYSVVDQRGVIVLQGEVNEDLAEPQRIETTGIANGMYVVILSRGGKAVVQRKLAVMNRN
jgi:hypothetical protein